jgi:hypothetical protein
MKPEEQLEHLIQMRQFGKQLPPTTSREILSRLAAMDSFARLRQIEVPSEFAARLEEDLRKHVRNITQKNSGVLGPDSTATQIMVNMSRDLDDQQGSYEHHRDDDS